jgi:hypothetical protein
MNMFDDFSQFFFKLDDEFFIDLYEEDYERIEMLCWFLTIDVELQKQEIRSGDKRLDD